MEGDEIANALRNLLSGLLEGDGAFVQRKAIEARPALRCDRLQPVERAFVLEHARVALQGMGRVEDAGAAAGRLLGIARVRRAVGAEEEPGRAGGRGGAHGEPVLLPL